ncbi:VWA domain-containing protein [Sulfurovum sp. TSL1]|uniref:vWA domain-containing protein n=1 Tax=Sulfurovum sp. TSL1 TaxID=2826994 RepID=UPI001CC75C28|nr:VWA domain-containing protein [Sulfurovum sp. TSL1]GIT97208.1 hypothetical protein TSL1_00290 [Sulfurovum sp. TSL1]
MFFLYEHMLYALLLPLLFLIFSFKHCQNSMQKLFSKPVLDQLSVNAERLQGPVRYRLFLLALIFFIGSIARPVIDEKNTFKTQALTSVVIALDVSKSMHLTDIYPSRFMFAREKLKKLISKSNDMRMGILFFARNAYMAYPVSEDIPALEYMLDHLSKDQKFEDNSNIFAAIEAGNQMLQDAKAKNMILLSDGGNSDDVSEEIHYLKENGITLYAIGTATEKGVSLSEKNASKSTLNPILKALALESRGSYEDFSWSENDINAILSHIRKDSQKEKENAHQFKQYTELFSYPLALGLLLLFFVFSSPLRMNKKVPFLLTFIVVSLCIPHTKLQAGVLDFMTLHKAKNLYDAQQYDQSATLYKTVVKNAEGYYNLANALYQAHHYQEAIAMYQKSLSKKSAMKAKILHNIGNCYVQMDALELAKRYYEEALKSAQNPLTKENLEYVDKLLREKKKKKQKKKPKRACVGVSKVVDHLELERSSSSTYEIEAEDLVLSEEERWMKLLEKKQVPIFLHKIETERMSHHVEQAW